MARTILTVNEPSPGRLCIYLYQGHGATETSMHKELSLREMQDLHEKLTDALWHLVLDNEDLQIQLEELASRISESSAGD